MDPNAVITSGTGTAWILAEKMLQGKYTSRWSIDGQCSPWKTDDNIPLRA
jgi:hypothetical protein